MTALPFVRHLRDLVPGVDIILSDIWGVIHDGLHSFPEACGALERFRAGGGTVVLITNAPRPADSVQRQLHKLGVQDAAYDAIVSSGDLTRQYVEAHPGQSLFLIGPDRDHSIFRGLDVDFAPLAKADAIVCTGPFDDETETPDDYREMLAQALARRLPLICANPDIVVERGDRLIYCAGAIAELYLTLGGEVTFYGKPYPPIYQRALGVAHALRGGAGRVLAIGDSVRTDLTGANAMGLDCVFLTRGIHADEFRGLDQLDDAAVRSFFGDTRPPRALMHALRW